MTVPLLPFSALGTWGCPFHGLVKNGVLPLPNSTNKAYPQPASGDSYLVKFAGVPSVERTPEQQASDTENGYQWLNYAIIAGTNYQLHGRAIGSPWLHKDESGRVWRVTVTHEDGALIDVAFKEFGRFSLSNDEGLAFSQSVTLTGTEIADIKSIELMDVHPEGGEAVFLVRQANDIAMVKLTVSTLTVTQSVIKSLSEMTVDVSIAEVTTTVPDEVVETPSYYRAKNDISSPGSPSYEAGFIEFSSSPLDDIYDFAGESTADAENFGVITYVVGSTEKERTDGEQRFFWACYDADGALHYYSSLHKRYSYTKTDKAGSHTGAWTAYADSDSADPGNILGSMSGSMTATYGTTVTNRQIYTYQLLRDESVMDQHEVSIEQEDYTGNVRVFENAQPRAQIVDDTITMRQPLIGGGSNTPVSTETKETEFDSVLISTELEVNYAGSYYLASGPKEYQSLNAGLPGLSIEQSTNKLVHLVAEYNYQSGFEIGYHIAPDAQDSIKSVVPDLSEIKASFQPVTGQIVREQSETVSFV